MAVRDRRLATALHRDRSQSKRPGRPRPGRMISRSSRSLPSGQKLELDLRLADRQIERCLSHACGCADAIRVEQLEDAALASVVAHRREALEVRDAADRLRAIALGGGAPLEHDRSKRCRLRSQNLTE